VVYLGRGLRSVVQAIVPVPDALLLGKRGTILRAFLKQGLLAILCMAAAVTLYGQQATTLTIKWDKTTVVSKSTPTLQVVVNPPLRHGEPLE